MYVTKLYTLRCGLLFMPSICVLRAHCCQHCTGFSAEDHLHPPQADFCLPPKPNPQHLGQRSHKRVRNHSYSLSRLLYGMSSARHARRVFIYIVDRFIQSKKKKNTHMLTVTLLTFGFHILLLY